MKQTSDIPQSAKSILKWLCKEEYIQEILGDLCEYNNELKNTTKFKRRLFLWFHVINFIKPWSIKNFSTSQHLNQSAMFKNFIISAFRSIKRQKFYATTNILGLSIGISVSMMLFLFIQHELSYDAFHEKGDRIFKVISSYSTNNGRSGQAGISFGSVAPEIKKNIAGVENAVRILNMGKTDISFDQNSFTEQRLYYTDKSFFDIFSFKSSANGLIQKEAFDNHGIILNQELADAMFGNTPPLNKEVKINGENYRVLDVVEVPKQSHLSFDLIISLENFDDIYEWSYQGGLEFHTYGLYALNADYQLINNKVVELYNQQMEHRFQNFVSSVDNYIMPFNDIYLKSENVGNNLTTGSINTIYILAIIDVLILFIAIVNYINLTTAQYEKRIKEIGVRKVIGANRKALVVQFLGESVVLTLMAFVISLCITHLMMKPFGELMQIPATVTFWKNPSQLGILLLSIIILGILSGLYPALFISRFNPNKILKRDFSGFKKGTKGSRILVTLQFIIAIVLLINLVFLNKQINFIKNKELGFSKDQVLIVNNLSDVHKQTYETIVAEIQSNPNVLEVSGAQGALGQGTSGQTVYLEGENPNTAQPIGEIRTMHNFLNTYDIKLLKGRDFSPSLTTDKEAFIINESGEKMLFPNGEDPIGKVVKIANRKGPIIGVVRDFHYTNLKRKISPLAISLDDPYRITLAIKINPNNIQALLNHVEQSLQTADSEYRLGYFFLDDYFNNMFQSEERNASLVTYSSLVAAIISLVGLIALISHSLAKRTKEVAIRKVLGAHFKQLLWVLTKEFYVIIILANIIAIPLAVIAINKWLAVFAYKIEPLNNWLIFILIGLISFIVTSVLITSQVIKRTKTNPSIVLGNE